MTDHRTSGTSGGALLDDLDDRAGVLPLAFEGGTDSVVLARMDRGAYERSAFLDQRAQPVDRGVERVEVAALAERADEAGVAARAVRVLLHSAFCGSTLLSRLLDAPGRCLAYKEPLTLHQLSIGLRRGTPGTRDGLDVMARLLGRTFGDGEVALIKPTDTAGPVGTELLDRHNGSRALVLADGLEGFVSTMLRNAQRRQYLRSVLGRVRRDLDGHAAASATPVDDAQGAALVWLGLARVFVDLHDAHPGRVAFMHADAMREDPEGSLGVALEAFGAGGDEREAALAGAADKLGQHSKSGAAFDPQEHRHRRATARRALADEIRIARAFMRLHAADALVDRFESLLGG
ncbi:MAG: hypothetical protein R3B49_02280 [Phycisphaerales bacterium]